jgi:hypothetical protein
MEIKIKNIVRVKGTTEVYEVINIIGKMLLCKPINHNVDKAFIKHGMPIKAEEVEVVMDQETDAFNLLFKKDPSEIS